MYYIHLESQNDVCSIPKTIRLSNTSTTTNATTTIELNQKRLSAFRMSKVLICNIWEIAKTLKLKISGSSVGRFELNL